MFLLFKTLQLSFFCAAPDLLKQLLAIVLVLPVRSIGHHCTSGMSKELYFCHLSTKCAKYIQNAKECQPLPLNRRGQDGQDVPFQGRTGGFNDPADLGLLLQENECGNTLNPVAGLHPLRAGLFPVQRVQA